MGGVEELCVHDRGLHPLAATAPLPLVEGLTDGGRGEESVAGVAHAGQGPEGPPTPLAAAILPLDACEAGSGLVVAGQRLAQAMLEAPRMTVDEAGVAFREALVVDAELHCRGVAHVVDQDVGRLEEPVDRLAR